MSENGELVIQILDGRNTNLKLPYVGVIVNGTTKLTNDQGIVSFFPTYPATITVRSPMYQPYGPQSFNNPGTYTIKLLGAIGF